MPYKMHMFADGGCRGNGHPYAIGAAAAVLEDRRGGRTTWTRTLPVDPTPTNQRAELTAIILALDQAFVTREEEISGNTYIKLAIFTDSKYAVGCMTEWIQKWTENGWRNAKGNQVANRDLVEEAHDLEFRFNQIGEVKYIWIPREQNRDADSAANDAMDDMR